LGEDLIVAFVTSNVEPVNAWSEHLLDRSDPAQHPLRRPPLPPGRWVRWI